MSNADGVISPLARFLLTHRCACGVARLPTDRNQLGVAAHVTQQLS